MTNWNMEMATTNKRLDDIERIGKVKMKLLRYMDDYGYIESPKPGRGMLVAISIGFFLAPFAVALAVYLGPKIDYWMGEFLKWLMI